MSLSSESEKIVPVTKPAADGKETQVCSHVCVSVCACVLTSHSSLNLSYLMTLASRSNNDSVIC